MGVEIVGGLEAEGVVEVVIIGDLRFVGDVGVAEVVGLVGVVGGSLICCTLLFVCCSCCCCCSCLSSSSMSCVEGSGRTEIFTVPPVSLSSKRMLSMNGPALDVPGQYCTSSGSSGFLCGWS